MILSYTKTKLNFLNIQAIAKTIVSIIGNEAVDLRQNVMDELKYL